MKTGIFASITKRTALVGLVFLLLGGGIGWRYWHTREDTVETVRVMRGTVSQEVAATGTTKPARMVDLSFERAGRVQSVNVDVGDQVVFGQVLAQLSQADLFADLDQAVAVVDAERAKLEEYRRGPRPEEVDIAEVKVANAEVALEDARRGVVDKVQDAFTKADDAISAKSDQFFSNPRSSNPQLNLPGISNIQLQLNVEQKRFQLGAPLEAWQANIETIGTIADVLVFAKEADSNLVRVRDFLDNLASLVNTLTPTSNLTQTVIDGYKADVSTARTNINTAIVNLTTAEEKYRAAQSSLLLAKNNLTLTKAGVTADQIRIQEAVVRQAEAKASAAQAQLNKGVIRAPIQGLISKRNADPGEAIAANVPVFSLISEHALEIEVFIPEIDVGKIAVGNPVTVTFDAFPQDTFVETIAYIDPAETLVNGVVNFKTKIILASHDDRMRSGLTANLHITTVSKEGVLYIPQYALEARDDKMFVQVKINNALEEREVVLGVRGQDGRVEVVSGLKEGDEIVSTQSAAK